MDFVERAYPEAYGTLDNYLYQLNTKILAKRLVLLFQDDQDQLIRNEVDLIRNEIDLETRKSFVLPINDQIVFVAKNLKKRLGDGDRAITKLNDIIEKFS